MASTDLVAIAALLILLATALAHPSRLVESLAGTACVAAVIVSGSLSWPTVQAQLTLLGPVVGFLVVILILAETCHAEGLFAALGAWLGRAGRHGPRRMLGLTFLTGPEPPKLRQQQQSRRQQHEEPGPTALVSTLRQRRTLARMVEFLLSMTFACGLVVAVAHVVNQRFVAPIYDVVANLIAFACAAAASTLLQHWPPALLAALAVGCWLALAWRTMQATRQGKPRLGQETLLSSDSQS